MYTDITQSVDVLPFEDSAGLPIADIFAPLLMEEDLKAKERMPNLTNQGGKELKSLREVFSVGDKPAKRIFLKGEAGCGKTLFCLKMLDTWCQVKKSGQVTDDVLQQCLAVFDLVIYIPMRNIIGNVSRVNEMISQSVSEQCQNVMADSHIHSLVILDGLDESPAVFRELLSMHGLVSYVLFCTTRPWKLTQLQLKFRPDDKVIQILGLLPSSEVQVIEYVLGNFYKLQKETQEFKINFDRYSSMIKSASLASIVKIPMMLTACCCMWYEEDAYSAQSTNKIGHDPNNFPDIHTSMTHTYLSLLDSMIRRADEKYDLKSFLTKLHPSRKGNFPKALSKFPYNRSFLGSILPLCRLAYTYLISDETKLVFQKDEIEDKIGRPLVQLALRVGLISQSKAPGRFYQQNVSINFYHKSIQEFMAAIHLTCTDTDDIRAYCTSLDKVLEVNNIITFMTGIDPVLCCDVSKYVKGIVNTDKNIQQHRQTSHDGDIKRIKQLCQAQCGWYREAKYCQALTGDTSPHVFVHVSDIYLDNDSDSDTVSLTEVIMYSNLDTILSVTLLFVQYRKVQTIYQYLAQCPLLSSLCITFMRNIEENDKLLSLISGLTQLDTILYFGAALTTAFDTAVGNNLSVYDGADLKIVKAILQLTHIKRIWLWLVDLGDDEMELTGDMIRLQEVYLCCVFMSERSWDTFVSSLRNLHQAVDLSLQETNIDDAMVSRILSSPRFKVTRNNGRKDETGLYKAVEFTSVPPHFDKKEYEEKEEDDDEKEHDEEGKQKVEEEEQEEAEK